MFMCFNISSLVQTKKSLLMKNLIFAATLVGMSLTSFSAPVIDSSSTIVKYDKKKNKKKGHKKVKHKKCEAYNG